MTARLEIERRLELPPADCFALWADPRKLQTWWGPKDEAGTAFRARVNEWDLKPGASWSIDMIAPDGTVYRQRGEMLEILPPRLIRFSFHWLENGTRGPRTEITVRFEADGAGTRLHFRQAGFREAAARNGHLEGWQECLDRLKDAARRELPA